MWSIMSNNINLVENFIDIIDNKYGLIIGVKYHSSNMKDACTMSLTDIVGCPAKVIQSIAFFSNSKHFLYDFRVGHQLANLGVSS